MVTCRELIDEVSRAVVTFLSWAFGLTMVLYLVLRFAIGDRVWAVALISNFAVCCFLPVLLLIPLGVITRSRSGLLVVLPLAAIGMLAFAPLALPRSIAPAEAQTLRIVTFNVYQTNNRLDAVTAWLESTDADIIFLQEAPEDYIRALEEQFAADYPHRASQPSPLRPWGNLLLSRYPILGVDELDDSGDGAPNTQQRYRLDMDGQTIAVYNIDLAFPVGPVRFQIPLFSTELNTLVAGYDDSLRDLQIERLITWLDEEPYPHIVAGDFNMNSSALIYNQLAARLNDAFAKAGSGFGGSWPVAVPGTFLPSFIPPLLRVDYVWYSDHFRAIEVQQGPRLGSDHLSLFAVLETAP